MPSSAPEAPPFPSPRPASDRLWTLPNLLSGLRVAGVPVFLYLVLGPHADGAALLVLMASGVSDYLDGKLARAWNQISRLGQLLDPLADRLYIASTIIALTLRGIVPIWLAAALFGRDLVLAAMLPVLRRIGYGPLPVHFLGKAATFNLLYAFPCLLLSAGHGGLAAVARPLGWAFTGWGTVLYGWSGVLYLVQVRQLVLATRAAASGKGGVQPA